MARSKAPAVWKKEKAEPEDEMRNLMDQRVKDILMCDPELIKKDIFYMKLDQAKLGMAYIRDREIMKRISSSQTLRVVNLISSNAVERQKYIKASMSELSVVQLIEGE
jgi:hypothetical protein